MDSTYNIYSIDWLLYSDKFICDIINEFKLIEYDDLNIHITENGKRICHDDNSF